MAINEKQKRFVEEYLIDLNSTQAAIRAGYSQKWAHTNASKLLQNTDVQIAISDGKRRLSERAEITQEMVLRELAKIGFSDISKAIKWGPSLGLIDCEDGTIMTNGVLLVDSDQLDSDTVAAIAEVSQTAQGVKIKLHDKRAALVDIGRHIGMFVERKEITGKNGGPIQANFTSDQIKAAAASVIAKV